MAGCTGMTGNLNTRSRQLPRKFGAWTGAAVVVGIIIGSGIFRVPGAIAAQAGNVSGVALVWILGGAISLFGALSLAELATMYPEAGGPYVYLREAYGKPLAFLFGWMWLITTPISWAAQALTFAEYLASILPMSRLVTHVLAALLITLICAAQYRSVRLGAVVQNISTAAKILAILGLSLLLLGFAPHGPAAAFSAAPQAVQWGGVGIALVAVLWAYDGWENLTTLSGEIRNPRKSLPRALIGGTLVVIFLYLAINAAFIAVLPFQRLVHSQSVAVEAVVTLFGQGGAALVATLVMVSVIGSLNGSTLSDSACLLCYGRGWIVLQIRGQNPSALRKRATLDLAEIALEPAPGAMRRLDHDVEHGRVLHGVSGNP